MVKERINAKYMKRIIATILASAMLLSLTACGSGAVSTKAGTNKSGVQDVIDSMIAAENEDITESETETESDTTLSASDPIDETLTTTFAADENVDVDLTVLSATMVFSTVYDMLVDPDLFLGKVVKMNGLFTYYYDEENDLYYYACIILDATACCSSGMEFVLAGDYTFPDDFPEDGAEITVTGVYELYDEDGFTFCRLANASMVVD